MAWMVLMGCAPKEAPGPRTLAFTAMGTIGELHLSGAECSAAEEARALSRVRETLSMLEAELSIYREGSIVSRLGRGEVVELSGGVKRLFEQSGFLVEATGGAFDPTVGSLMHEWGFRGGGVVCIPDAERLAEARERVGWERVLECTGGVARLVKEGTTLDFGAIAKGFAVDEVFERLEVTNVLVNLGGNMRGRGVSRGGADGWTIAVRDPFAADPHAVLGSLLLTNGFAVATSGNYEQYIELEGIRYTHIVDPRTGYPVQGMAQVTVVAPTATMADGLSTACFLMGMRESERLLSKVPGASAYLIPDEDHGGLKAAIELGEPFPWREKP